MLHKIIDFLMRWLVNKDNVLIIHFPIMLDDLLPESFRPLALFLNPGLHDQTEKSFCPDNLVLDQAKAKTFLTQSIQFGEQFRKPADMAYLGALRSNDFYSDTSLSLGWQISTYGQDNSEIDARGEYLKAQQLLILEYIFEERTAELGPISTSLGSAWMELDSTLGIERGDEEFIALDRDYDFSVNTSANWKKLLCAFALFLPEDSFLLIHDRQIAEELEEAGVVWKKSGSEKYWSKFPFEGEILKGTLKSGQKKTYLGRIKQDLDFLLVNILKEEG